jgi:hypothetical protein
MVFRYSRYHSSQEQFLDTRAFEWPWNNPSYLLDGPSFSSLSFSIKIKAILLNPWPSSSPTNPRIPTSGTNKLHQSLIKIWANNLAIWIWYRKYYSRFFKHTPWDLEILVAFFIQLNSSSSHHYSPHFSVWDSFSGQTFWLQTSAQCLLLSVRVWANPVSTLFLPRTFLFLTILWRFSWPAVFVHLCSLPLTTRPGNNICKNLSSNGLICLKLLEWGCTWQSDRLCRSSPCHLLSL